MITQIYDVPDNMVAFRAEGQVSSDDFDIVNQKSAELVEKTNKLNYLLLLDTPIKEFTSGAWLQDILLGMQNITKWNRAAIITDSEGIQDFTAIFSKVMPGEFRGFPKSEYENAIDWVSGRVHV